MRKRFTVTDHSVSKEEFELVYNEHYDYYITKPIPKDLKPYYESDNYISHTDSSKSIIDKLYQLIKKINLSNKTKLIEKYQSDSKKLLDIGAGTGDFLKTAKDKGWEIYGVEPNSKARDLAHSKEINLVSTLEELKQTEYDVITLWHVLEHIPDLEEQLTKISSLLKPSGTLIVAVPNFKSYDAKHYKTHWAAYDVPRHLYHFSQKAISRIFSKYHISLVQSKPMLFDAYYVSLLSEKYKSGKNNYMKAFLVGFLSNFKAFFTKEHSSLIYILKKD